MAQTHSLDLESSSSQYASRADAAALRLSGDFTVEAWIKLESLSSTLGYSQTIVSKDGTSVGWTFRVETSANKLDWVRNGVTQSTGATALVAGVWYHVAATLSSTTLKIYLNGKEDYSGAYTDHTDATNDLRVGNSVQEATRYFDGLIKDVRLFSDARTAAEVMADGFVENVADANLVAEWNFNNVYTDSSGSGYTLTASGSPVFSSDVPWATGDVAVDAATTSGNAGSATLTFAHTVTTNSNRVLFVGFTANKATLPAITSVTYNGVTMTASAYSPQSLPSTSTVKAYLYYLLAPATGSNNVVITFAATCDEIHANAVSYYNVGSVPQDFNTNGTGTTATLTTTTTVDRSWLVGIFRNQNDGDGTAGSGTTKRSFIDGQNGFYDTNGAKTPTGSYSIIATSTSAEYGAIGMSIGPAPIVSGSNAFFMGANW